ncbi:MAG: (Fe-S)-binding protein [Acidimicrobiia bacterium]|nr:(Fe-S)-binding protein [Acidimicrobiia bacterium]
MAQASVLEIPDLTLDGLLATPAGRELLSCIQCGTCAGTCPYGDFMRYTPRRLIGMLREGFIEEVLSTDDLLTCVTCYDCWAKCPRGLRLTDVLLPAVKEQVLLRLPEVPAELQSALANTMRYGNPMGESPRKRAAWVESAGVPVPILRDLGRPVDVLWIVECYTAYYPRGQDNARATARILHALGVDFAILGNEEKCVGECARLVGEKGLFDTLREQNAATYAKYEFGSLLTCDPHAFDALAYVYPALGLSRPVDHTTPFVAARLDALRPLLTKDLGYKITYHDSCVLGRHNHMHDEPRRILDALPGVSLVEMTHNRDNTICCGGGGGGMWLDTFYKAKGYPRLSDRRVEEALATGADVLAVSCPYEVPRFEDSLKVLGGDDRMVVRDVMELVAEALAD